MQSSSSRPVSKKRLPSKAISLRLETSLVPGSGPSRLLSEVVVVRRVVEVNGDGEKALLLFSSNVVAQRAKIMDDFLVAVADMLLFLSNLSTLPRPYSMSIQFKCVDGEELLSTNNTPTNTNLQICNSKCLELLILKFVTSHKILGSHDVSFMRR